MRKRIETQGNDGITNHRTPRTRTTNVRQGQIYQTALRELNIVKDTSSGAVFGKVPMMESALPLWMATFMVCLRKDFERAPERAPIPLKTSRAQPPRLRVSRPSDVSHHP